MPEGHKTHHLARVTLYPLIGETIHSTSPQGRFRSGARKLSGRRLLSIDAVGKHLFFGFTHQVLLQVHLGRYGRFRSVGVPPSPPRGQVRLRIVGQSNAFDLNGPTTCRLITPDQREQIVSRLGPDPLGGGGREDAWQRISRSGKPIGTLLLDQSMVAGVGNIFRAEVLFETGIDPTVPGKELTREAFDSIWRCLLKMMRSSLKYGKIVSVTYREAGKRLGDLEGRDRFRVYGKTHCPWCAAPIETATVGGRKLYLCTSCQTDR